MGLSSTLTVVTQRGGFAAIELFPAGDKEGQIYQGGRSEEDFIQFINEKAGTRDLDDEDIADGSAPVIEISSDEDDEKERPSRGERQ